MSNAIQLALGVAEAGAQALAQSSSDPAVRLGAQITASAARLIRGIVERHGQAGALEALRLLEQLSAEGPQTITNAQLTGDDATLRAEIESWYERR
jgi:hypothetical protein